MNTLLVNCMMIMKLNHASKNERIRKKKMYFLIEDDVLLEKYNAICDKVSADINKKFHRAPIYNKKFLTTKEISKTDSNGTCLVVISLDSALG